MLSLSRNTGETIYIGDDVCITVLSTNDSSVKLGIVAPKDIAVHREEIYRKVQIEQDRSGVIEVTGTVYRLLADRGFGFIYVPGYEEGIFFHASSVCDDAFASFTEGEDVTLVVSQNENGYVAKDVKSKVRHAAVSLYSQGKPA